MSMVTVISGAPRVAKRREVLDANVEVRLKRLQAKADGLDAQAIVALAPEFHRVLRPGGILLASGFERHEVDQVSAALPPVLEARHKGEWSLVAAKA